MIKEAIGYGATIEEAKENAVLELNVKDDADIEFDVIAFPQKKVLGLFGGSKAQVKAFIKLPDPKPQKTAKKEKPAPKKAEKKETQKPAKETPKTEELKFVSESELASDSRAAKAIAY